MDVLEILGLLLIIMLIFGIGVYVGARVEANSHCGDYDFVPSIPGPLYCRIRNLLLKSMLKGVEMEREHKNFTVEDMDKEIHKIIKGFPIIS